MVVTGASTGIGWGTSKVLTARGGVHVFGSVRRPEDAQRLRDEFGAARFTPLLFDVTDEDAVREAAARVRERLGARALLGLVNNAGVAVGGPLLHQDAAQFRQHLEVDWSRQRNRPRDVAADRVCCGPAECPRKKSVRAGPGSFLERLRRDRACRLSPWSRNPCTSSSSAPCARQGAAPQRERAVARFRSQKYAALLAFLAFHRGRGHLRGVLIELIWPGAPSSRGGGL